MQYVQSAMFADRTFVREVLFGLLAEGASRQDEQLFEKISTRVAELGAEKGPAAAGRALAQTLEAILYPDRD